MSWLLNLGRKGSSRWLLTAFAAALGFGTPAPVDAQNPTPKVIRFGFSRSMFREMNEADTRAAVRSYAVALAQEYSLVVDSTPGIFSDVEGIGEAFASGSADVIAMSTEEYLALEPATMRPELFTATSGGRMTEQYIVVVRIDSEYGKVSDLKGRKLMVYDSVRAALGSAWLEVLLDEQGCGAPQLFFSRITPVPKLSRAVLPVFFNQADACLVTQNGFQVLGELNPQILKQLRVLERSPEYVPSVTAMRSNLSEDLAQVVLKATLSAQHSPAGQQVLTMFQCDHISELRPGHLENARALYQTRDRIRAARHEIPPPPQVSALPQP